MISLLASIVAAIFESLSQEDARLHDSLAAKLECAE